MVKYIINISEKNLLTKIQKIMNPLVLMILSNINLIII